MSAAMMTPPSKAMPKTDVPLIAIGDDYYILAVDSERIEYFLREYHE